MAGYDGNSMSNNARKAYSKGKKPVSRITKDDILKFGINESIAFFRWYVKSYCKHCEWHHSSPEFNITLFYDIKDCCNQFKKADIEKLKVEYKEQTKSKSDKKIDDEPYYAKVNYSIKTRSGNRKYFEVYAVVQKCWAYIKDDYLGKVIRKKIDGKHFFIAEKFQARPKEMPDDEITVIWDEINKH